MRLKLVTINKIDEFYCTQELIARIQKLTDNVYFPSFVFIISHDYCVYTGNRTRHSVSVLLKPCFGLYAFVECCAGLIFMFFDRKDNE